MTGLVRLATAMTVLRRRPFRPGTMLLFATVCMLLASCAQQLPRNPLAELEPLQFEDRLITLDEVAGLGPSPDLLAIDDEMRDFVARYADLPRERQRLMSLHRAVRGPGTLGIEYDPEAEGSAREVFSRGSANCLSYATLFIALAREAGLDANYQWLKVRPQWTLQGERVMLSLHVNVIVSVGREDKFMVDIDPLPSREITGTRALRDSDATALYHANIAMYALSEGRVEESWLHSARALQLSPEMALLWVNIGAVYRAAGQHRTAEAYYLRALEIDPWNDSAMNNLVVLYALEGRDSEQAYWNEKVEKYRDANPYYHAWLGDQAADDQDWPRAISYYTKAIALHPQDSRLLYAMGLAYQAMDDAEQASGYIRLAIEHATLRSDIDAYQLRLKVVEQALLTDG